MAAFVGLAGASSKGANTISSAKEVAGAIGLAAGFDAGAGFLAGTSSSGAREISSSAPVALVALAGGTVASRATTVASTSPTRNRSPTLSTAEATCVSLNSTNFAAVAAANSKWSFFQMTPQCNARTSFPETTTSTSLLVPNRTDLD